MGGATFYYTFTVFKLLESSDSSSSPLIIFKDSGSRTFSGFEPFSVRRNYLNNSNRVPLKSNGINL